MKGKRKGWEGEGKGKGRGKGRERKKEPGARWGSAIPVILSFGR